MLANALVCATLPTTDLQRAKRFYEETLGLTEPDFGVEGGVFYTARGGTKFRVYERPPSTAEQTVAVFLVGFKGSWSRVQTATSSALRRS